MRPGSALRTALIGVAGALAIGLVSLASMLWLDAFDRQVPLGQLSAAIREQTALAHLWLEEGIGGDPTVDYGRDVEGHLSAAAALVRAALESGPTDFGEIDAVDEPRLRADLGRLSGMLRALRETAAQRWNDAKGSGATGTPRDQVFDQLFREAMALAAVIGGEVTAVIRQDRRAVLFTNVAILALIIVLLGGIHVMLERHRRALQAKNVELEQRVQDRTTELSLRNEDLALARDRADQANAAKNTFLANMSHEVRTPLNAVIGMASVLVRSGLTTGQRRSAEVIEQSSQTLLRIIDDVLDLSKIEAGRLAIDPQPFVLPPVLSDCLALFRQAAADKQLELRLAMEPATPSNVIGDSIRLRQILINLLGNAVKFTDAGRIDLVVAPVPGGSEEHRIRFEVRDTGIGIPAEARDKLFRPFSQVDQTITRRFGGTGLGLAISKRLAEMMGGEIGCESAPGAGSTFWFVLPLPVCTDRLPDFSAPTAVPASRALAASRNDRILVVEDHPVNREVALRLLESLGHEAETAANGEEALRILEKRSYAAVLMDSEMPGLDGYATIGEIRRRESGGKRTPILVVSAHAMAGERDRALAAGADGYVAKPLTLELLEAELERTAFAKHPGHGSAPPAPKSQVLVAPAAIDRLRTLGGDQAGFVGEVVALFLREAPVTISNLRGAASARDGAGVHREAHRLLGSCRYVGAELMADTLRVVEAAARDARWNELDQLISRLEGELAETSSDLMRALERSDATT